MTPISALYEVAADAISYGMAFESPRRSTLESGRPGAFILKQPPEIREALRGLKSDDLRRVRFQDVFCVNVP